MTRQSHPTPQQTAPGRRVRITCCNPRYDGREATVVAVDAFGIVVTFDAAEHPDLIDGMDYQFSHREWSEA